MHRLSILQLFHRAAVNNKVSAIDIDRADIYSTCCTGDLAFPTFAAVIDGQRAATERDDAAIADGT